MSLEFKLILTLFFAVYLIYFLFSKNYVKTYIPFLGIGFLLGPNAWKIIPESFRDSSLLLLGVAIFILGMQMGRGFKKSFWKKFPAETFLYNLVEKFILISSFLLVFFLFIPSISALPFSFPFYLSILAFSSSVFFMRLINTGSNQKYTYYYEINNLIIIFFFLLFHLFFPLEKGLIVEYSNSEKLIAFAGFVALLIILLKIKLPSNKMNLILWISIILLGAGLSRIIGFSSLLIGFFTGIFSNFFSLRKQESLKKFLNNFNEHIIILFLFMTGFFMKISYSMLIIGVVYVVLRIFSRIFIRFFSNFSLKNFFKENVFFLFQGEYFLAFLLIYGIAYHFEEGLSIALISLIFSEFIINFYYHRFLNKS